MSDLYLDEEHHGESEVLSAYWDRKKRRPTLDGKALLDPIDKSIVGGLRLRMLAGCFQGVAWLKRALGIALGSQPLMRRVQPLPPPVVRGTDSPFTEELVASGLLRRTSFRGKAPCGLFFVPKTNGLLRVIFDARPANGLLEPTGGFVLFTLDELLSWTTELGGAVWSVIDIRHHYYQIPIHTSLQEFFRVTLGKQGYFPSVLPMGFHDAVLCGESVSWAIVLFRERNEDALGAPGLDSLTTMPRVLVLQEGLRVLGVILVLIDGIATRIPDESLRSLWEARLKRNCTIFNLRIKDTTTDTFSGIEFAGRNWRTARGIGELPPITTRRSVAVVLGTLLWEMRVRQVPLLLHEDLLVIWSKNSPKLPTAYDEVHDLSGSEVSLLSEVWMKYMTRTWTSGVAKPVWVNPGFVVVTDATPTGVGWVIVDTTSGFFWTGCVLGMELATQVDREMEATVLAGEELPEFAVILLGVDADAVRGCIDRNYSRSPRIRALLRRAELRHQHRRCVRVPGIINPADCISRGKPLDLDLLKEFLIANGYATLCLSASPSRQ